MSRASRLRGEVQQNTSGVVAKTRLMAMDSPTSVFEASCAASAPFVRLDFLRGCHAERSLPRGGRNSVPESEFVFPVGKWAANLYAVLSPSRQGDASPTNPLEELGELLRGELRQLEIRVRQRSNSHGYESKRHAANSVWSGLRHL